MIDVPGLFDKDLDSMEVNNSKLKGFKSTFPNKTGLDDIDEEKTYNTNTNNGYFD